MKYPEYVSPIINRLEENGYEAYIVGGSVRDFLIGREPGDFDVTTSARPEQIMSVFSDHRLIPTGLKHGTVTVISEGRPIEVTTFRIDGEYRDSRHPESVSFTDDITSDLSRRDFTVNAMAFSETRGLVDPFGGRADIALRVIRAVGDPERRFSEDALRVMRAFRFSAVLGYRIEEKTLSAAVSQGHRLCEIAKERISAEFLKLIVAPSCAEALRTMIERRLIGYVLDNYIPSEQLLCAMERSAPVTRIRLGILMSEAVGEDIERILTGLKLPKKLISWSTLIASKSSEELSGTEVDARRFIGGCGDLVLDVLEAARALRRVDDDFCELVQKNVNAKNCASVSELKINGHDLIKLGFSGREVGEILSKLVEAVVIDPSLNTKEKLEDIAVGIKENNCEKK